MKKLLTIAVASAMAVSLLAGCGSASGSAGSGKKYVIATDTQFAPFEFTDSNGKFVGIDVDILDAIAKDQGFDYELNSLGFDAALIAVQSGQADGVIAGMSITDARKETFDFSESYYDAEATMATAVGSDIDDFNALAGKKVAVKTGTNGADFAKSMQSSIGFEITEFSDSPTMYQDVIAGNTDACFEDYPVMAYNIKLGAQLEIPDGAQGAGTPYGFAVKKGENAELLTMFEQGLKNIKANGTYDKIIDSYTK
ncbi:MAG: transporter substrate-binding domain-containing protein [Lachnospiraceae bacterium]|nr:transporter substrate-binding domain-containing protein [Lachnospiraceae bacterium]